MEANTFVGVLVLESDLPEEYHDVIYYVNGLLDTDIQSHYFENSSSDSLLDTSTLKYIVIGSSTNRLSTMLFGDDVQGTDIASRDHTCLTKNEYKSVYTILERCGLEPLHYPIKLLLTLDSFKSGHDEHKCVQCGYMSM
jgi:hypothetical protein